MNVLSTFLSVPKNQRQSISTVICSSLTFSFLCLVSWGGGSHNFTLQHFVGKNGECVESDPPKLSPNFSFSASCLIGIYLTTSFRNKQRSGGLGVIV